MPKEDAEPPRCAVCGLQRAPNAVLLPFPDRRQSKLYGAWLDFVRGCPGKSNWLPDSRTGFVCTLHFTSKWLRRTTGSAYHNNSLLLRTATVPTLYTSPEKRRRIAEASSSAAPIQAVRGPDLQSTSLASTNASHRQLIDMHDANQLSVNSGQGCSRTWDRKPDSCLTVGGHFANSVDLPTLHVKQEQSGCISIASGSSSTSSTSTTVVAKTCSDPKKTVSSTKSLSTHSLPDTGRVPIYASVRRTVGARRTLSEDTDAMAGAAQSVGATELERPRLGILTRFAQNLVKNVKNSEQQESSTGLAASRDNIRELDAGGEDFTAASNEPWSEEETKLLLDYYTTYIPQVGPHDRFKTKKLMYEEIAREMSRVLNVQRTGAQCKSRLSTLRKQRRKADKNYETSGDARCSAPCGAKFAIDDVLVPEVLLECEK
ncbi:uncharacterized protein LOC142590638 isoform X1 [Dermacentor variabilis]|uniref:uncharacterized protein LOC142590638 isoform X1 n=1 Tax=Dermacentor variabilis TaxID=34621 RepID=UPI003F5B769F